MKTLWGHFEEAVGAVILAVMALLAFINVLTRYFIHYSFAFTEEIEVALLVWLTMLGGAAAFKRGLHLGFTFLAERFPLSLQKGLTVLNALVVLALFVTLGWFGYVQVKDELELQITTEALGISQHWYTLALPIGAALIIIRALEATAARLKVAKR